MYGLLRCNYRSIFKRCRIYEILIVYFAPDIYISNSISEIFYKTCINCANHFTVTLTYLTCATHENIYIDPHSFILNIQNRDKSNTNYHTGHSCHYEI